MERDDLCKKLVTLQYERNDINFIRNKFRVHGDTVDIYLAYMSDLAIRVEFFGDEIDRITEFNPVTGTRQNVVKHVAIFPASHYIVSADKKAAAIEKIRAECDEQVKKFTAEGKLIEGPAHPAANELRHRDAPRWASARALRTTPLSCRAVRRAACPRPCWTISRRIFCFLWMRAM